MFFKHNLWFVVLHLFKQVPKRVKLFSSTRIFLIYTSVGYPDPRSAYFYRDSDPQKIRNNLWILNIPSK